jgi:hypothetical protein
MWGAHDASIHNIEVDEATTHLLTVVIPDFARRMDSEFLGSVASSNSHSIAHASRPCFLRAPSSGAESKHTKAPSATSQHTAASTRRVAEVGFDVKHLAESLHRFGIGHTCLS